MRSMSQRANLFQVPTITKARQGLPNSLEVSPPRLLALPDPVKILHYSQVYLHSTLSSSFTVCQKSKFHTISRVTGLLRLPNETLLQFNGLTYHFQSIPSTPCRQGQGFYALPSACCTFYFSTQSTLQGSPQSPKNRCSLLLEYRGHFLTQLIFETTLGLCNSFGIYLVSYFARNLVLHSEKYSTLLLA